MRWLISYMYAAQNGNFKYVSSIIYIHPEQWLRENAGIIIFALECPSECLAIERNCEY